MVIVSLCSALCKNCYNLLHLAQMIIIRIYVGRRVDANRNHSQTGCAPTGMRTKMLMIIISIPMLQCRTVRRIEDDSHLRRATRGKVRAPCPGGSAFSYNPVIPNLSLFGSVIVVGVGHLTYLRQLWHNAVVATNLTFAPQFSSSQGFALEKVKAALLEQGRPLATIPTGLEPAPVPPTLAQEDERSPS